MLENRIDVFQAYRILDAVPEAVKHLIREGEFTATRFGNRRIMKRGRPRVFLTATTEAERRVSEETIVIQLMKVVRDSG